jgi:hypothetical protein
MNIIQIFNTFLPEGICVKYLEQIIMGRSTYIEPLGYTLQRDTMGQFHWVSKKYLNAYIDEFCCRYNAIELHSKLAFDITIFDKKEQH